MKKLILAMFVAGAVSAPAIASNVQLYGVLDTSIGIQHIDVTGQESTTKTSLDSGRFKGSRWGIKGGETLSADYKVSFVLEGGLNHDTGEQTLGRLFGRESSLSLHTPYGTIGMGRLGNLTSFNGSYTLLGPNVSPFSAALGIAGHMTAFAGQARHNNSFTYRSPTWSGWTGYVHYALQASDAEESSTGNNDRQTGVGVTFRNATSYLAVIAEEDRYANSTKPNQKNARLFTLAGHHKFGVTKVFLGGQYLHDVPQFGTPPAHDPAAIKAATPALGGALTGFTGLVGVSHPIGGGMAKAQVSYANVDDNSYRAPNRDRNIERVIVGVGYEYPLSKRTGFYTQLNYGHMKESASFSGSGKAMRYTGEKTTKITQFFLGMYHQF